MSAEHDGASYNHSCSKAPVMVSSSRYDRTCSGDVSVAKGCRLPPHEPETPPCFSSFSSVKSYLKFYESIPDYTELHHLSNEEFYTRLKSLKITQNRFRVQSNVLNDDDDVVDPCLTDGKDYGREKFHGKKKYCSVCCLDVSYCRALNGEEKGCSPPKITVTSDNELASEGSELKKISDYEADRESSTFQPAGEISRNYLSAGRESYLRPTFGKSSRNCGCDCDCDSAEFCFGGYADINFGHDRSFLSGHHASNREKYSDKNLKKAQPVNNLPIPITSRIPLYDKIMEKKEARRRIIHERYSQKLKSLVRPFSFTKREEEIQRLQMVRSNPELNSPSAPAVRFKATPIPKNLFSDYAYERMREEEFYRALRKRIRAEEMLKSSSLPPSMALRERRHLSKSLDVVDSDTPKSWENGYGYDRVCRSILRDVKVDEKRKSASPQQKKKKNLGWLSTKCAKRQHNSTTESSTEASPYQSELSDVRRNPRPRSECATDHKSNLASILRIETARKRLEKEMEDKLRENRLKHEAKFKARLVRMAPDWKALYYDKEEDFAVRVAARKEEDRLRQEEHHKSMASMYGRVYRMPPMFNHERFRKSAKKKNSTNPTHSNSVLRKSEEKCHELEIDSSSLPKTSDCFESSKSYSDICNMANLKEESQDDVNGGDGGSRANFKDQGR